MNDEERKEWREADPYERLEILSRRHSFEDSINYSTVSTTPEVMHAVSAAKVAASEDPSGRLADKYSVYATHIEAAHKALGELNREAAVVRKWNEHKVRDNTDTNFPDNRKRWQPVAQASESRSG